MISEVGTRLATPLFLAKATQASPLRYHPRTMSDVLQISRMARSPRARLSTYFLVEFLCSIGQPLLTMGIFFYTHNVLHFSLRENLLLAVGQGVVYTIGAMLAHAIVERFGQRRALIAVNIAMCVVVIAAVVVPTPMVVVAVLLVYTFLIAINWPMLESRVSGCGPSATLSGRIGLYNFVWSFASCAMFALTGAIIAAWPSGMFAIPLIVHALSAVAMWIGDDPDDVIARSQQPWNESSEHPHAELALRQQRTLALWLSRLSLPSMYVVSNGLVSMMPSLPSIQGFSVPVQTALGSLWLAARCVAFVLLGITVFWHARPKLLLLACAGMLVSFLLIALPPSHWIRAIASLDRATLVVAQLVLGLCMGIIYAASLYFGMVLSEGSTEHGGYHEALIGLGFVLGPGAAFVTQQFAPGNVTASVYAVAGVVAFSLVLATGASVRLTKTDRRRVSER
jgi:MFS family permease